MKNYKNIINIDSESYKKHCQVMEGVEADIFLQMSNKYTPQYVKRANLVKRLINIGHIYTANSKKWKPFIDVTPSEGFVWWEGRGNDVRERFNEIYDSIYDGRKFNPFIYDESGMA